MTWPRSACSPRPTSRVGSVSARTWPGSACWSPSTSTSGGSAGRSSSAPRRRSARPSSSPSTTPQRRQFSAVDAAETSHPIRYLWESLRDWSDLHLGSSGKGILAFLPPDEQDAILDRLPDPIPGRTALTKARLREELAAARQRGYVVSHGERFEGAVGVSAPVRDARGRVVGDLIATWPDNRTDADKEAAAGIIVRSAADDLSRRLGWSGADPAHVPGTKGGRP